MVKAAPHVGDPKTLEVKDMSHLVKNILFLGAAVVLPVVLSFAQTSTTALSGTVYDSSGAVVVGAAVTATNDATGVALKQSTNSAGLYA